MFWTHLDRVSGYWPLLLKGVGMTIALSALALLIGVVLGFAFGMIRAGRNKWLSRALGLYIDFFRGTPFLLQVFIAFFILPEVGIELSAFAAGVVALSNMAACFIAEIVASGIKSVPVGQVEAALSFLAAARHGRAYAGIGLFAFGHHGQSGRFFAGALVARALRHARMVLAGGGRRAYHLAAGRVCGHVPA